MKPKQTGRHQSYTFAFQRLNESLKEGWLLEAITLEESIISDRLASALQYKNEEAGKAQSLNNLIAQARKHLHTEINSLDPELIALLDKWRVARNKCIHGICKLDQDSHSENAAKSFENNL